MQRHLRLLTSLSAVVGLIEHDQITDAHAPPSGSAQCGRA